MAGLMALLDGGNVSTEILKPQRQLIRIKSLRAPPELHTLELPDLTITMLEQRRHIVHQRVQTCWIPRQVVEVDLHDESYCKTPANSTKSTHKAAVIQLLPAAGPARQSMQLAILPLVQMTPNPIIVMKPPETFPFRVLLPACPCHRLISSAD